MISKRSVKADECREFLIIPPFGAQFDELDMMKRITEALGEEFPESMFTVTGGERGEDFAVYPVLGLTGSDQPLLRIPDEGVVAAISDFLQTNFSRIPKPALH